MIDSPLESLRMGPSDQEATYLAFQACFCSSDPWLSLEFRQASPVRRGLPRVGVPSEPNPHIPIQADLSRRAGFPRSPGKFLDPEVFVL